MKPEEFYNILKKALEEGVSLDSKSLLILVSIALFSGFLVLIVSYLKNKGKNLADKEDIQKITALVEEVKTDFIKETEFLKANLNILTNTQLNLISEERNAIIDINKCYFAWFDSYLRMPHVSSSYSNEEIDKFEDRRNAMYETLSNSEAIFNLLVSDDELKSLMSSLKIQSLKNISKIAPKFTSSITKNNLELDRAKKKLEGDLFIKKHSKLMEERIKIISKGHEGMLEAYKSLVEIKQEFQHKCRDYLYKLVNGPGKK